MPTIRQLKRRIVSVKNTAKITNALQLVAASKMRRAQDRALQARPYASKLQVVLAGLSSAASGVDEEDLHPLLKSRPVKTIGLVHVTPDRGLCGGLNANLNRSAGTFAVEQQNPLSVIAVGRKGRDFFIRNHLHVEAEFTELGDYPRQTETVPIAGVLIADYLSGAVDAVYLSYADFVSTVVQRPVIKKLLPIEPPRMEDSAAESFRQGYIIEPSPRSVFERLLPRYIEMLIYHAVLESAASEQSARMVAMKNASDNAQDITKELTLTYNKARQEQITKELLDIVGGAAALGG